MSYDWLTEAILPIIKQRVGPTAGQKTALSLVWVELSVDLYSSSSFRTGLQKPGFPPVNDLGMYTNTKMICFGIFFWMVMQCWSFPLQNSSVVHEAKMRIKREFSEELLSPDEMNSMDKILKANNGMTRYRSFGFREGDIAGSGLRSAITCPAQSCLWPKSVDGFVYVPYTISPLYDNMDRITVEIGMLDISSATCVKFVPRTHQANFIDIQPKLGCWSFLGMVGGAQQISLQTPACMWSGVASHELMHALGFVHEQSRSDRDQYVTILWDNIIEGQKHNFRKYETNNLNTVYDYDSVMHYGRFAFSEDGSPTIIPKPDPNIPIGQRDGPSLLDIHKINLLYNCGGLV